MTTTIREQIFEILFPHSHDLCPKEVLYEDIDEIIKLFTKLIDEKIKDVENDVQLTEYGKDSKIILYNKLKEELEK